MRFTIGAAMLGLACAAPVEAPWGGWNAWQPSSGQSGSATISAPPSGTAAPPAYTSGYSSGYSKPSGYGNAQASGYSSVSTANVPIQSGNPFSFPLSNGS